MPALRLSWRNFANGLWLKGPREANPPGTLRRAKSVFPLRSGAIRSRSGIHSFGFDIGDVNALFKFGGERIAGSDDGTVWRTVAGTFTELTDGVPALDGARLKFLACPPTSGKPDYVFAAGGGALFKIHPDLDEATQWGIDPPEGDSPTAAKATVLRREIDDMDATTGWLSDGNFASALATSTKRVEGTNSLTFEIAKDGEAKIKKEITIDLSTLPDGLDTVASGDEDYIEIFVAVNRPKRVVSFEIIFYVGAAPSGFDVEADTYSRELTFQFVKKKKKRALVGTGDFVRNKDVAQFLADGKYETVDFSTAEFLGEDEIAVAKRVWARLTIPKSSFNANGSAGQTGFTWADVKAVQINVEANKQGQSRVWIDRISLLGGVGMQGTYQYMFTYSSSVTGTRSNPFPTRTDPVTGATLFDPVRINNVERQGVELEDLPAAPADTQVDRLDIWRTVGNGSGFFLADRLDVTDVGYDGTYLDRVADYPGMFGGGGGVKFLQPEELPDDNDRPDDSARAAIGPVFGRMWLARTTTDGTQNRAWYSPAGRFEAVSNYIEVGGTDEAIQAFAFWAETLFIVTTRTLYRVATTEEPFIAIEVQGAPGTRRPDTVVVTDAGIVYQALDGVRIFDGNTSQLVGEDALAPVFRGGSTVDGIAAMQGTCAVFARGEYYLSDGSTTTLAYAPDGGWRNVGLPSRAFYWEQDTRVLLAAVPIDTDTFVASLEGDSDGEAAGVVAENTRDITVGLLSTFEVETGAPDTTGTAYLGGGVWGLARRITIEGQLEAMTVAVSLVIDNTVVSVGNITLTAGTKRTMELGVHRWGFIQGVRLSATSLTKRIEISAIELDVYLPTPAAT